MEPRRVVCPRCKAPVRLPESGRKGDKVRCPRCRTAFLAAVPVPARSVRKKKAPSGPWLASSISLLAIVVVVLGGGVAVAYWAVTVMQEEKEKPSLEAPKNFVSFRVPDGSFRVDFPSDWKHKLEGQTNRYVVDLSQGRATFHIIQGPLESLEADIAAAGEGAEADLELAFLTRAHEQRRAAVTEGVANYQQEEPEPVDTRFGRGLRSTFTAIANDRYPMRGYRATLRAAGKLYDILCMCPETDWENLQPAFARMIESMGKDS
jgi:predicted Zn finger-like uncharacterized protein